MAETERTRSSVGLEPRTPRSITAGSAQTERGRNISAAKMGHSVSNETREKLRRAFKGREHAPLEERLWAKVERTATCWLWRGAINGAGYGVLHRLSGTRLAYRIAYELTRGPVPQGLELDHLCRNRACVNPVHLEPVTRRENILRGLGPTVASLRRRRIA